jgi:hypothetical protein
MIIKAHREPAESRDQLPIDTVLYTTEVVNTPARVQLEIRTTRERLRRWLFVPFTGKPPTLSMQFAYGTKQDAQRS